MTDLEGKNLATIRTYLKALEKVQSARPSPGSSRRMLGRSSFPTGSIQAAERVTFPRFFDEPNKARSSCAASATWFSPNWRRLRGLLSKPSGLERWLYRWERWPPVPP
jgi:hypothetical protein